MDWNSLWSGILSNALYGLLILGGGAVLATLRLRWPNYSDPVRYGVIGAACVAVILFTLTGHGLFSKPRPEITTENLESSIRKWSDDLGLGVTRMQPIPNQEVQFGLVLTLTDGNPLTVFRGVKEKTGFLQMECALVLSPEHLAILSKLSKQQADDAMQEIILEMNRSRIGFIMQTSSAAPNGQATTTTILQQKIIVTKPLPITDNLTEAVFGERINELDSEIGIVRATTDLTLKRYSRQQLVTPHVATK